MWTFHIEKLVLEMLANRRSPLSIQANIVLFCCHILPGQDVVEKVPCVEHIWDMRTVQLTVAKTIAGKSIANQAAQLRRNMQVANSSDQCSPFNFAKRQHSQDCLFGR